MKAHVEEESKMTKTDSIASNDDIRNGMSHRVDHQKERGKKGRGSRSLGV